MLLLLFLSLFCVFKSIQLEGTDEFKAGWHQRIGTKNAEEIRRREDRIVALGPIVGGNIAPADAHPYLAGLLIEVIGLTSPSACGASLISSNRLLTAAHCWFDGRSQAWRITAVLGSPFLFHGGIRVLPTQISMHPHYDHRTFANDIAVLYIHGHIPTTNNIRPISLPHEGLLMMDLTDQWGKAAGYGRYSDTTNPTTNVRARSVWLRIIPLEKCRADFGSVVLDSNICTYGRNGAGICQGDSGGPLTVTQTDGQTFLIGVSSFVAKRGCQLGFPSVFARVSSYIDWIRLHL